MVGPPEASYFSIVNDTTYNTQGPWLPPYIPNPEHFEDSNPLGNLGAANGRIGAVAIEVCIVRAAGAALALLRFLLFFPRSLSILSGLRFENDACAVLVPEAQHAH